MVQLGVDNDDGNWFTRLSENVADKLGAKKIAPYKKMALEKIGKLPSQSHYSNGSGSSGRFSAPAKKPTTSGMYDPNRQKTVRPEQNMAQEESDLEKLISEMLAQTKEGHTWESRGEDEAMINQIFGSQLSAIANARNDTNSRFNTSLANTKDLYSGHEHDIRNADKAQYQQIATDQKNATNSTFDSGVKQMQDTRTASMNEQSEMLSRLGLEASAPVVQKSANDQQGAIDSLITTKVAQQKQDAGYASANMQGNDERAQSIADESVAQQADLSRQLQSILGELGNKEADINSQKAEALYGASKESQANWRSDRQYATDSLAQMLEAQAKAQSDAQETQSSNAPQMQNILNGLGITNPNQQSQYSSAYTDAMLNANYVPGGRMDEKTAYLKYLTGQDEYEGLDPNLLQQMITGNLNYGSYKVGAPTS